MEIVFEVIRVLTALTGFALLGRLIRDRFADRRHFISQTARLRWWMMVLFTSTITLTGFLAAIAKPLVTVASLGQIAGLVAISIGHYYRDVLRTSDEAENAARVEEAKNWLEQQIHKGD